MRKEPDSGVDEGVAAIGRRVRGRESGVKAEREPAAFSLVEADGAFARRLGPFARGNHLLVVRKQFHVQVRRRREALRVRRQLEQHSLNGLGTAAEPRVRDDRLQVVVQPAGGGG